MSDQGPYRLEPTGRPDSVRTDSPPLSTVSVPYDFPAARTAPTPIVYASVPRSRGRRRTGVLGGFSVAAAVFTVLVEASGIELATRGEYGLATVLAIIAIAASILAFVLGSLAAVLGRGRVAGIAGAALGLIANPLFLIAVLRFASGA